MNKIYTLVFTFCLLFGLNENVLATHAAGGELTYVHVAGNTYQFTFKFYRDCGAVGQSTSTEPPSFQLCYASPCTGATISTVTMPKIVGNISTVPPVPNGTPLNNGCDAITTCTDINSPIHGYRQWWYTATVTLPTTCNAWRFWTTLCCRNDLTLNIGPNTPGSYNIFVETTFDNTISNINSSPAFVSTNNSNALPVPYVCINNQFFHTGGAMDPDGDSLVFETIAPRHQTGCNATAATNILEPAFNILNTAGEPLTCGNSYNLNTSNGHFNFMPTTLGYYALCIKVSEYRNGVLIGTNMRDMQIVVDVCTPIPVLGQLDPNSVTGGNLSSDTIYTCPESNLKFCFELMDLINTNAHLVLVSDNHATAMPGSIVTFTNPTTNVLRVCVDWTSSLSDTVSMRMFSVTVKDTVDCISAPGIAEVPIVVRRQLYAGGDTSICYGDTVAMWCFGNGQYTWNALPGGDNNTSLSCIQCDNPLVSPNKTTDYEVTDDICGFKDTIRITIYPSDDPVAIFELTPKETTMENPTFTMINKSLNAISYAWFDSSHNFLANTKDLIRTEPSVGHYCYTLEATSFCHYTRSTTKCADILGDGFLGFPTVFSPNGDGKNDLFHPLIFGDMSINNYYMTVYNRWGMQLWKSKNMLEGWNGTYKGKECEADTYYYYVEAFHALNQKLIYKGDFILIR